MLYTHVAAAVVALGVGFAAGWQTQGWRQARAAAELQAQTATLREEAMHGALIETTRRLSAQQEAANAAESKARRARADAAAAGADADSLREYAAQLAADASACDPTAAAVSTAANAPGAVLADMLGRLEASGRELAAEADRRGVAGSECEWRYQALTP